MSFLDDIVDVGRGALGWIGGDSIAAGLARTAITGYALNRLTNSINKENSQDQVDPGVREQVDASPDHYIPVVYGTAYLGGIITDAVLTNNNNTMYYCLTLSEKTGNTGLGAGNPSTFQFGNIYRDDMRLVFANDGITVKEAVDRNGTVCTKAEGKIRVYCFAGNSSTPIAPKGYTNVPTTPAYSIMPGWTSNHDMTDLVFAIVSIDYDATNDIRGLGNFRFELINSMSYPGDCLYDYMTNTRYGAGIPAGSIYTS